MSETTPAKPSDVIGQLTAVIAQRKPIKSIPIPPRPVPTPSNAEPLENPEIDLVEVRRAPRREGVPPHSFTKTAKVAPTSSANAVEAASPMPDTATAPKPGPVTVPGAEGTDVGRQRLVHLTRDQIIVLPDQPRTSGNVKVHLGDLAESIAKIGLRVPLQGRWDEATGKYQLFDGHRRLLALDQIIPTRPDLGESIPMLVLADEEVEAWQTLEDHERMFILSLVVNTVREDLSKADRGRAYESFVRKYGLESTSRMLGISKVSIWKGRKAARDADQHTQRGETFDQPTWVPKYSVRTVKSVLKLSADRWEPTQREVMSKWLRAVARSIERGEAKLPTFPISGSHDETASSVNEQVP